MGIHLIAPLDDNLLTTGHKVSSNEQRALVDFFSSSLKCRPEGRAPECSGVCGKRVVCRRTSYCLARPVRLLNVSSAAEEEEEAAAAFHGDPCNRPCCS